MNQAVSMPRCGTVSVNITEQSHIDQIRVSEISGQFLSPSKYYSSSDAMSVLFSLPSSISRRYQAAQGSQLNDFYLESGDHVSSHR